jgi:signal transduction histidine kinase
MVSVVTLSTLALNALAAVLLGWTTWTAYQSREQPSATPFIALLATLTLWAVFSLGSELPGVSTVGLLSSAFDLSQFGTALAVPGAWTVYALSYTGRGTGLTWKRIVLLAGIVFPVAISAIVIAVGPSETAVERAIAPLIGWEILYLFALFVYATYLLFDLGGSHARVSNTQVLVLTTGVAAPYLVSLLGPDSSLVGNTTMGLLLSGGLLAAAVRRYPLTTGFPKADYIARTRVVETLQEGLVVLDWDDHVLDVNEATVELFDPPAETMIGAPIRTVIDGLDGTDLPPGATGTVALRTSNGRRQFQFSVSAVHEATTDDEDNPVARTVLFRDVTDRRTREQRLTVLNRILRHNVRNDLDVVLAYADQIDDEEIRAGVRENTASLLELSTKVRDAAEVMAESTEPPESVDLADVAHTVVDQFRDDDESADISLVCPDEVLISSHRAVIRQALSELVENSLEHTTTDSPHVEVSVREASDETVELSVADDGPGLPERERDILDAGTETQLKHGQGIGLWFVTWAVTQLGGDLQFRANDPEGSVVTIRLYDTVG